MNFRFLGVWLFASKFIYLFAKAASRAGKVLSAHMQSRHLAGAHEGEKREALRAKGKHFDKNGKQAARRQPRNMLNEIKSSQRSQKVNRGIVVWHSVLLKFPPFLALSFLVVDAGRATAKAAERRRSHLGKVRARNLITRNRLRNRICEMFNDTTSREKKNEARKPRSEPQLFPFRFPFLMNQRQTEQWRGLINVDRRGAELSPSKIPNS